MFCSIPTLPLFLFYVTAFATAATYDTAGSDSTDDQRCTLEQKAQFRLHIDAFETASSNITNTCREDGIANGGVTLNVPFSNYPAEQQETWCGTLSCETFIKESYSLAENLKQQIPDCDYYMLDLYRTSVDTMLNQYGDWISICKWDTLDTAGSDSTDDQPCTLEQKAQLLLHIDAFEKASSNITNTCREDAKGNGGVTLNVPFSNYPAEQQEIWCGTLSCETFIKEYYSLAENLKQQIPDCDYYVLDEFRILLNELGDWISICKWDTDSASVKNDPSSTTDSAGSASSDDPSSAESASSDDPSNTTDSASVKNVTNYFLYAMVLLAAVLTMNP